MFAFLNSIKLCYVSKIKPNPSIHKNQKITTNYRPDKADSWCCDSKVLELMT